ncbi:MAG: FAD-dependent oxidoreductase [Victivallaceae bacterium]
MKIIIIGAVAAGASAAARLRRLDENAEIVLLERGQYMSYANCGLPYHLGNVIPDRDSLLVMPEKKFKAWFNIDVRLGNEVIAINRANKSVSVRKTDGTEYEENYDKLLLATGSRPIDLPLPGIDDSRIHTLWTIPDMDAVKKLVGEGVKKAVVVGGGFIGLETAENLHACGIEVTIVQHSTHVMPNFDREMAYFIHSELAMSGIDVLLNSEVTGFTSTGEAVTVNLKDGAGLSADLVIISAGVKPNSELAGDAGLLLGARGHIQVNKFLQTSDENIYAAGDAIEFTDPITGTPSAIPLAGPANKQGRIAAGNMLGGTTAYPGSFGTSVIKIGSLTAAGVGLTEGRLLQLGLPFHKVYTHPASNASYYPGGEQLHMKLLFAPDGKIYGAQIVGRKGVDKRLDVIASAMESGRTAPDLAELELAYAPPYSSAKDPVNFLGMIAQDIRDSLTELAYADSIPEDAILIDVREEAEHQLGSIPGAQNIPLGQLRTALAGLDKSKEYIVHCQVGLRGYLAERIMKQNGFRVKNLSGGYLTWKQYFAPLPATKKVPTSKVPSTTLEAKTVLDVRTLACPGPVVRLKNEFEKLNQGETCKLMAAKSFAPDLAAWSSSNGNTVISQQNKDDYLEALIMKGAPATTDAGAVATNNTVQVKNGAIILFSNDFDKVMAALIIACGMAAAGMKTGIFFTFWGLNALRRNPAPPVKKSFIQKMFGFMMPCGVNKLVLSKMNFGGMGTAMMKDIMKKQNVMSLPDLLRQARELGVKFTACEMAMNVMGITREELIEVDEVAGIASFVESAKGNANTLFI